MDITSIHGECPIHTILAHPWPGSVTNVTVQLVRSP